jgi:hypothetical protein
MKRHKPGSLSPSFHAYLEYLEAMEQAVIRKQKPKVRNSVAINNRLWTVDDSKFNEMAIDMMAVDATLARTVRSSVKYKVSSDTLVNLSREYGDKFTHIGHTTPLHLPHEWCTIIIQDFGLDDMIIVAQKQTAEHSKTYPELELEPDEPFICLNMVGYRKAGVELDDGTIAPAQQLSHFPVEIHCSEGKLESQTKVIYAAAEGVEPTQMGMQTMDLMWRSFLVWHHQFQLQSALRRTVVEGARLPKNFQPRKARKKHEHPKFEHTIIQMEVDAPDPQQVGRSILQPSKRLHQVRGFWRHYKKSGKRVWVKPHWRGDKEIGVVRRDIELIQHEDSSHA